MHALEINADGSANMAYTGATPWHGFGKAVVDEAAMYDSKLFIGEAGLDTENEKVQLCTHDTQEKVDQYAVRRINDGKVLGVVGERYTILQNREAFQWFDPWLVAKEAQLHTAGSLFEGSRIWVQAKLARDPMEIAAGDIVEKYVLLSHSHDGSLAIRVAFTPQRVVCWNTLSMAHKSDASKIIRLKHSKKVHQNLDNLRETMNLVDAEFEATAEQYRLLASKDINQNDLRKYMKRVFKIDADDGVIWTAGERSKEQKAICSERQKNIMDEVMKLMDTGKGNNLPSVKGTYWSAYNSVTQYLSWEAGRNADNRLNSLWFGQNATMNQLALDAAVEMATAA